MYKIDRYLWKKGLKIENQRKLAKKIGMNECHLSVIVNGKRTCPTRTAMAIANSLNGSIEDFFERI